MSRNDMDRWSKVVTSTVVNGVTQQVMRLVPKEKAPEPRKVQTLASLDPIELEHRRRANQVEFDLRIARSYNSKSDGARNRNLKFDLTLNDWTKLMSQPTCLYSGVVFSNNGGNPNSRTMERVNPKLGYTAENTIAVTDAANGEKANLDAFMKGSVILPEVKLRLLRKAAYQIEKQLKMKG